VTTVASPKALSLEELEGALEASVEELSEAVAIEIAGRRRKR
jgi:hypothetical protein